ncbi:kinase-like domain-containing protein, partial [Filobasidium floriforme]
WLLEDFQNGQPVRYSGSLEAGQGETRSAWTVSAYAHLAYEASGRSMVLSDLEGWFTSVNILLFDPMLHSLQGELGIGDAGETGINAFIDGHLCNRFCHDI